MTFNHNFQKGGSMKSERPTINKRMLVLALKQAEGNFGSNHLNTASALENLAKYLSAQNLDKPQHPDAEPLCRRMIGIVKDIYGEDSIQYANAASLHAQMLGHVGRTIEAASLMFKSWQLSLELLGRNHDITDVRRFMFLQYKEEVEDI
jgi:hypothetical protein